MRIRETVFDFSYCWQTGRDACLLCSRSHTFPTCEQLGALFPDQKPLSPSVAWLQLITEPGVLRFWGSSITNTLVAVFQRGLFVFCQNDPISFHKIERGWAFLAAVGQQGENSAPGIGINSCWCSTLRTDWQEGTAGLCVVWENEEWKTRRALNAPGHEELQDFVQGDSRLHVMATFQCGNCTCSWGFPWLHWNRWDLAAPA